MLTNVPYVEPRRNKDGSVRYYWRRRGFKLERLPADEPAAVGRAIELNDLADRGLGPRKPIATGPGTVADYLDEYEHSDAFAALAASTRRGYLVEMARFRAALGPLPVGTITRRVVKRYLKTIDSVALRRRARNVLLNVLEIALDDGEVAANPARGIRLPGTPKRDALWSDDDIDAFVEASHRLVRSGAMIRLGFALLLYTGQRIGDVLAMRWSDYDGDFITVRQQKTGKRVAIYCHRDLKAALRDAKRRARGVNIVALANGRPTTHSNFRSRAKETLAAIGRSHLQLRDLRRTAVTRLAEAGCTEAQVASITGHSIDRTRHILDTYIVRTKALAKSAIVKLESNAPRQRAPTSDLTD